MIGELLAILEQSNLIPIGSDVSINDGDDFLSEEDIADAIWLALKMGINPIDVSTQPEQEEDDDQNSESQNLSSSTDSDEGESNVSAYIPPAASRTNTNGNISEPDSGFEIEVESAPALRNPLEIGRVLRPLMRKVASSKQVVIDEAATVYQVAEKDIWLPVLKGAPERWLSLELIIEQSEFSFIWQSTISEFQQVLEHQGAFRSVRVWHLKDVERGQLTLVPQHLAQTVAQSRSPKELVDPTGRTLIVMISDCRSAVWRSGKIHHWLRLWSQKEPTLILQLLPERSWSESELDVGYGVQVSSSALGAKNPKLLMRPRPRHRRISADQTLLLPIAMLTPESLKQWALVVAGIGNQRSPARWFNLEWVADANSQRTTTWHPNEETAEAKVEYFFGTASPMAKKLVKFLSAVPINLSVVYLIQKRLIPDSDATHIAEVFNSSLLEARSKSQTHSTHQVICPYDFAPGVRGLINDLTAEEELLSVIQELSQEIIKSLKLQTPVKSFTALLSPSSSWPEASKEKLLPFAQVTNQVLRRLGGDYAALADAAERYTAPLQKESQIEFELPPLQALPFVSAYLADPNLPDPYFPPELYTEEFSVPAIALDASEEQDPEASYLSFTTAKIIKRNQDWEIERELIEIPSSGYFIETLSDSLSLTLLKIPAGTFMMGSPENEVDRYSDESPQHPVNISQPFWLGQTPITEAQWRFACKLPEKNRPLNAPESSNGDDHPIVRISWLEAVEFCDRLSTRTGRSYRLPTEAEWEYACRAGTTTPYHFGETISPKLSNYSSSNNSYNDGPTGKSLGATTPVGQYDSANRWGLSDMHGNVWELCQDNWHGSYEGAPSDGSAWGNQDYDGHVLRGGSWDAYPRICRSASRDIDFIHYIVGFRVACSAPRT